MLQYPITILEGNKAITKIEYYIIRGIYYIGSTNVGLSYFNSSASRRYIRPSSIQQVIKQEIQHLKNIHNKFE